MPKMALHDFTYPLGHITTAKFWQNVEENGAHLTLADTGWAKAAWGKIYGQWISGCAVFVYDF
jgi:acetyl-CoA synthetase